MKTKKLLFYLSAILVLMFTSVFVNLCYASKGYILLYSTLGYHLNETKRVLVRSYSDSASFAINDSTSIWNLYDVNSNKIVMSGNIKNLGRTFGVDLWEIDFSLLHTPGVYKIKASLKNELKTNSVELATENFDVLDNLFFKKTFPNMSYINAEERASSEDFGYGYYDCNSKMGEAWSHGVFLAGLVNSYVLKENVLTEDEKIRLINSINIAVDYLLSLHNSSTGEINHEHPSRPGQQYNNGKFQTTNALYGLVTYMNYFKYIDPARASNIHNKVLKTLEYLNSDSWPRHQKIVTYYYLYNYNNADIQYKEQAINLLNAQMADFDLATANRGWCVPFFEGLYLIANAFPDDPAYDSCWLPNANRIVENNYKYILENNGYHVLPQGGGRVDWDDMASIPKGWSENTNGHNYYSNPPYGVMVQDAIYLAKLTGEHKTLKPIMAGSLGWITGLNLGIQSQFVSGVKPAEPIACSAFIMNINGKYARPWSFWDWGINNLGPTKNLQSILTGYYILNGNLVYNNAFSFDSSANDYWTTGETFILNDGTFIQGSAAYENYLQEVSSTLISIEINPENVQKIKGETQQYIAIGRYMDSSLGNITSQVTWASSNTGVATITSDGFATGIGIGNTNITASLNNVTGNTAVFSVYRDNLPPIFETTLSNAIINESYLLTINLNGVDPDGDIVTYSASGLPSGAKLDSIKGIFSWTPTYNQAGIYNITFTISDGILSTSQTISITVIDVTKPDLIMTVLSTAPIKVAPGSTLLISNTAKNQGSLASGAFKIGFHLSKDQVYGGTDDIDLVTTRSISSLGIGASSAASTTFTIPVNTQFGSYYVCAFADKVGIVAEGHEENNTISTSTPIEVAGADLIMTAVSGPSTGIAGTSIPILTTVRNQGKGNISSFNIGIYLSSDSTISSADVLIGTRSVSSLYETTNTATTSGITLISLSAGKYYIGAIADYKNARPETNEKNNTLTGNAINITSGLDAIVTAVSCPLSGSTGTYIPITSTVKNQGVITLPASVAGLYLSTDSTITTSDTLLGPVSIPILAAGASGKVTASLFLPVKLASKNYFIGAIADYKNAFKESNEANNALAGNTIEIKSGVDVIVTSISGPSSGVTGTTINITSTIKNQGIGNMPVSTAGLYLSTDSTITTSDTRLGAASIPTLAAGASSTVTKAVTIPSLLAAKQYYIGAIADYTNAINESIENNNALLGNLINITKP